MWLGVFLIAAAVVLVGLASKIGASEEGGAEVGEMRRDRTGMH